MGTPLWLDQINSDRWIEQCNYAYAGQLEPFIERRCKEMNGKLKLFRHPDEVGESGVIFCGTTQSIKECLQSIPENGNYILITRDNDQSISEELFKLRPKSIKHWLAVNCAVTHSDITAIPFGIATLSGFNETLKLVAGGTVRNNGYKSIYVRINISPEMIYQHERHRCLEVLSNNPLAEINYNNIGSYEMYNKIMNHPFVACPIGSGADTLRIWETITLGAIPIVTECKELLQFTDIPILYTKDWIFDKDYLRPVHDEYLQKVKSTERVRMSYWIEQLNEKRKLIA